MRTKQWGNGLTTRLAWAVVALAVAIVAAFAVVERNPQWIPDSYGYAIRMLMDRGESFENAKAQTLAFFASDPVAKASSTAELVKAPLPEFDFVWSEWQPRILYPFLASLMYPLLGFHALLVISIFAYVLAAIALYFLLLEFGAPWLAAVGACGVVLTPECRFMGESATTDMLAMLFWVGALLAMCRVVSGGGRPWLAVVLLSSLALDFTRPDAYLPFVAALGVVIAGLVRRNRAQLQNGGALVAATGLAGVALFLVSVLERVPGLSATMAYLHAHAIRDFHQPADEPFQTWYGRIVASMYVIQAKYAVRGVMPLAALAGIGLRLDHPAVPLLIGSLVCNLLVILIHPVRDDAVRVIDAPLYPVIAAGSLLLVSFLIARFVRPRAAVPSAAA